MPSISVFSFNEYLKNKIKFTFFFRDCDCRLILFCIHMYWNFDMKSYKNSSFFSLHVEILNYVYPPTHICDSKFFFKCFSPFFITSTQMMKLIFLAIMIFFFSVSTYIPYYFFFGLKNSFFSPSCEIIVLEDKVRTIWNVICHF